MYLNGITLFKISNTIMTTSENDHEYAISECSVHRFAKFYGFENRICKEEMVIHFLFPYSQFVPLKFGNV